MQKPPTPPCLQPTKSFPPLRHNADIEDKEDPTMLVPPFSYPQLPPISSVSLQSIQLTPLVKSH